MSARCLPFALLLALPGCYGHGDHDHEGSYPRYPTACSSGVVTSGIDRGGFLELDPGFGVGATVEYAGDGFWRVATACDTLLSGYACVWDIVVVPLDSEPEAVAAEGLEREDALGTVVVDSGARGIRFIPVTRADIDAFTFQTEPGDAVRVDALLDGECLSSVVSWMEAGAVVSSATEAVDLEPLEP